MSSTLLGVDEILNLLESRTVVGIRDDCQFWRDNDQAPWSGRPIWSRRTAKGRLRTGGNDAGNCGGGGRKRRRRKRRRR